MLTPGPSQWFSNSASLWKLGGSPGHTSLQLTRTVWVGEGRFPRGLHYPSGDGSLSPPCLPAVRGSLRGLRATLRLLSQVGWGSPHHNPLESRPPGSGVWGAASSPGNTGGRTTPGPSTCCPPRLHVLSLPEDPFSQAHSALTSATMLLYSGAGRRSKRAWVTRYPQAYGYFAS